MSKLSKMLKNIFMFTMSACVTVAPALASGGSGGAVATPRPEFRDDFVPTRSLRGELIEISETSLTVRDGKGKATTIALNGKTKFKTEDKTLFTGKAKLSANDFSAGLSVRVLYREGDASAVEVKALKPKKSQE
jgi:hypothetical protein